MNATRRWNTRSFLASTLFASLALAAPAAAQSTAMAETLFDRGVKDMEAGNYQSGCPAIAESHRLDPRPGTLFTLAVCETRWGKIAKAASHFRDYLELYEKLTPDQQSRQRERPQVAKQERERLLPDIPELTLSLPPDAPAGTVVKMNGVEVGAASLGIPLRVDPGEITLSTQAPGGPLREQRITLEKAAKRPITLEVAPPEPSAAPPPVAPAAPAPPPPAQPVGADAAPSGRRTAAYVIGGVGAAGLVLGGVMGGLALGKKGVISDHCGSAIGQADEAACDSTGLEAADSVKTLGLVSTIGFGVGLAGIGTAVVLLLTEPSAPAAGDVSAPRRLRLRAGVLSAGPEGAVLGARGSW